jgi:hypothetical protein
MSRQLTAKDYAAKTCVAPCKDCPDRAVGCHAVCDKYKQYHEQYRKVCNDMYTEQKLQRLPEDFAYSNRVRHKAIVRASGKGKGR